MPPGTPRRALAWVIMAISDEDIQWLLALVESEDLAEIEVHEGESEVLVRRSAMPGGLQVYASAPGAADQSQHAVAVDAIPEGTVPVVAPTAGIFYRRPSPDAPSYVEVGQDVRPGDTIGLIEVMKLFNDVTSTVSGVVCRILVQHEEIVESGRILILVQTGQ